MRLPSFIALTRAYRRAHFDYHTPPSVDVVAKGFDAERFVERLAEAGCQAFNFFAKDVFGNCYWDTKVGNKHPHLDRDLLGEVVDAAKRRGLRVIAYYNVMDLINARKHPEWRHVGHPAVPGSEEEYICPNSPWIEEVFIPELRELARYDLDGVFFDFLYMRQPCACKWCRESFEREAGEPFPERAEGRGWRRYIEWVRRVNDRLVETACSALHSVNPQLLVAVNWAYTPRQPGEPPECIGYLTLDVDETRCPVLEASYHAKYFDGLGRPFEVMITRFLRWWGDWGLKPLEQLLAECASIIANGGACNIGDHLYVDGGQDPAALELMSKAFKFIRAREEYLASSSVPYVAVLLSAASSWAQGRLLADDAPLRGVHLLLLESGVHHDVLLDSRLLEGLHEYRLVIVPSQRVIEPEFVDALREYVAGGGSLLVTFDSSLTDGQLGLGELLGVELESEEPLELGYIKPLDPGLVRGLPESPIFVRGKFLAVRSVEAEVLAERLEAYRPPRTGLGYEDWLGAGYGSPVEEGAAPAITIARRGKGVAAYVAADIFRTYYSYRSWAIRRLVRNLLDLLIRDKLLEVEAPPTVEVTLRRSGQRIIVHLVNWQASRSPSTPLMSEEVVPVPRVKLRLRLERRPAQVKLVPVGEAQLEWLYEDGWLEAVVEGLKIHSMIIAELAEGEGGA
ncbi:MAG: hypothetical protein DRJ96_07040 [Thermoprotei archaeon]|nr:MAG: hypothetical protein DRJ96_07040 [Thermoprotei archaeon]